MLIDALAETAWKKLPIHSFGGRAKRRDGDRAKTKPRLRGQFVPDLGNLRCRSFGLRWSEPWRTALMKRSIAASSMSWGAMPSPLACRARRESPMPSRRLGSFASSSIQAGLKVAFRR